MSIGKNVKFDWGWIGTAILGGTIQSYQEHKTEATKQKLEELYAKTRPIVEGIISDYNFQFALRMYSGDVDQALQFVGHTATKAQIEIATGYQWEWLDPNWEP